MARLVGLHVLAIGLAACGFAATDDVTVTDALRGAPLPRHFQALLSTPVEDISCDEAKEMTHLVSVSDCRTSRRVPAARLLALSAAASQRLKLRSDARDLIIAAQVDLVFGDTVGISINRAVSYLEAARVEKGDADLLTDLSAAYLRRAEVSQSPRDLLLALQRASEATRIDSANAAAIFNRALALHRLHVPLAAVHEFRRAARRLRSTTPVLAEEALRFAAADSARIATAPASASVGSMATIRARTSHDPLWARSQGWDTALVRWGSATLSQNASASDSALGVASRLAGALLRSSGDTSLSAALSSIRSATPEQRTALARGHLDFGRGRASYEASDYAGAVHAFDEAIRSAGASPSLRLTASLWKAISLAQRGDLSASTALMQLVRREAAARGFVALKARAMTSYASTLMRSGSAATAFPLLEQAREAFLQIGERPSAGMVQGLIAVALYTQNDDERALRALLPALELLSESRSSVRLHNALYLLATLASRDSLPLAAHAAQIEGIAVAEALGNPLNVAEAYTALGRIQRSLSEADAQASTFRQAELALDRSTGGILKDWIAADLLLARAQSSSGSSDSLIERLSTAVSLFRSASLPLRYLPLLRERALLYARRADTTEMELDLQEIVAVAERELRSGGDRLATQALRDAVRSASELLALTHLARNDIRGALDYIEIGRSPGVKHARAPRNLRGVVLDFAEIEDTLYAWVIRLDTIVVTRTSLSTSALHTLLRDTREQLELGVGETTVHDNLARLYEVVMRPIESLLPDSGGHVRIVADGALADAPLSAFWDRVSGRYAVQRWTISYSTSFNDIRETIPSAAAPISITLVADPAFDARAQPQLARLPGGRSEVRAIAALYRQVRIFEDSAATVSRVLRATRRPDVIHFAGHATFDAVNPDNSTLLLAPSGVTAADIAKLRLDGVRTVVLSACESGRTSPGGTSGFLGLAGAFHSAGVRNVVGGLWRVDDRFGEAFFLAYHREYVRNGDAPEALRVAQLEAMQSQDVRLHSPSVWAGYRVVGSS